MRDDIDDLIRILYPNGLACERCGATKLYRVKNRKSYTCSCGKFFTPTAGTVFYKSRTPLRSWIWAAEALERNPALSASRLSETLSVTYKTAWRMKKLLTNKQGAGS